MQINEKLHMLATVLDCFPDAVALCDATDESRYRLVNSAYAALTGVPAEKLLGMRVADGGYFLRPAQLHAMLVLVANGLPINDLPVEFRSHEGDITPTSLSSKRIEVGGEAFFIFVHRDMTDRNYAERRLEENELRWRMAIEGLGDALWDWDVEKDIVFRSPRFLDMLNLTQDDVQVSSGEHFALIHEQDRQLFLERLREIVAANSDAMVGQCRMLRPVGEPLWVGYRCCVIERDFQNQAKRVIGTLRDISEQRQQQQALEMQFTRLTQAGRLLALGEMVSAIGHEINQPLAVISSYAGMLGRRAAGNAALEQLAQKIEDQAIRAGEIIWRMRELAKPGASQPTAQALKPMLNDVLEWMRLEPHVSEYRIIQRIPAQLPLVHADRIQIQQVLSNLLRNAIQASHEMPTMRQILVSAWVDQQQQQVVVQIADHGKGLPDNFRRDEFPPIFATERAGLGLGLSICQSIVQRHGGRIWARPRKTGGAVFAFSIPVAVNRTGLSSPQCAAGIGS